MKTVFLNAAKLDYDKKLDFSPIKALTDFSMHDTSRRDSILERVGGQGIVITKEMPLDGELIAQFPSSVKLICEAGTGYNNIDIAAAREKGIGVCNVPGYSTEAVAQLAITFMLNFSSSMVAQQLMLKQGDRSNFTKHLQVPHFELMGKTLGVIGGGAIGGQVMKVASALGMKILVYSRTPRQFGTMDARMASLAEVLGQSDFITIHCPLTPETRHLIDMAALKMMKPSAYLINTARGAIIKETDLIEALQNGVIAGAALDVQDPEPPLEGSPLYDMENVILTPHIGWKCIEARQRLIGVLASNIKAFLEGSPVNLVNMKSGGI